MLSRAGDKIRVKRGELTGQRGVLIRPSAKKWIAALNQRDRRILLSVDDFTNYSLAARRAWQSMPDRKVGRPPGSRVSDRVSVIFRIDRALWSEFVEAEGSGRLRDRTAIINECIANVLFSLRHRSKAS